MHLNYLDSFEDSLQITIVNIIYFLQTTHLKSLSPINAFKVASKVCASKVLRTSLFCKGVLVK